MSGTQLVWLKRDLRLRDHAPLAQASRLGRVMVVYVYEPSLWQTDEMHGSHLRFINQCLRELDQELRKRGARLVTQVGELPEVFDRLLAATPFERLWSHEETGSRITYDRDRRVARWCKQNGVEWTELPQNGVVRPLRTRDGWAQRWRRRMDKAPADVPARFDAAESPRSAGWVDEPSLGLSPSTKTEVQLGGMSAAHETLESFLEHRGVNYRADMASPVAGWDGCSRLSPYLAWGAISIKEVYQQTKAREAELKEMRAAGVDFDPRWIKSLSSYFGRLSWHCHFMQKLEDEPDIEFQNMSRAFDGLREDDFDPVRFEAWCEGQTGYPMVDACMRCLHETGWLNFRMRAMLVSFASYHLWLHWRPTAVFLAQHFLDFEPGIHFSQFQMQSGVTGINTVRVYSPAKQAADQDPSGSFIKRWVPELSALDSRYLAEPHLTPPLIQRSVGCVIGRDYPAPIVEHKAAYHQARAAVFAVRKQAAAKAEAKRVYQRHGSRKRTRRAPRRTSD